MTLPWARLVVVTLAWPTMAARADQGPRVVLDACRAFAGPALMQAIASELRWLSADRRTAAGDRVLVVECPSVAAATVRIELGSTEAVIERRMDLEEVPHALRVRLIALVAAELINIAATVGDTAGSGDSVPDAPAAGGAPAPSQPPATHAPSAPAPSLAQASGGDSIPSVRVRAPATPEPPRRRALLGTDAGASGVAIAARAGVRLYFDNVVPMYAIAADAHVGMLAVGLGAATGERDDVLGSVRGYLAVAALGLTVACGRAGPLELCAAVRAEGGIAAATARATQPDVSAASATAPYAAVGAELDATWPLGRWAVVAAVDGAWAAGINARAEDRIAFRLAGPTIALSVGLWWWP